MSHSARMLSICGGLLVLALLVGLICRSSLPLPLAWNSSASSLHSISPSEVHVPTSPIHLRATGHGLFWRFSFAGVDQQFGTPDDLTVNKTVHLPIDSEIQVSVESDDLVYSFSAPELRLRQIAVPELSYSISFRTDRTGQFALIADPLCGVRIFHDADMGRIVVQSRNEFEAWYVATYSRKTST